jgi:hypothetical protein
MSNWELKLGKHRKAMPVAIGWLLTSMTVISAAAPTPFANNNGAIPAKSAYDGPLFQLSHDWPVATPAAPTATPWAAAIGDKPIDVGNAAAYVKALKDHVGPNARQLIWNYANWDANKAGWYNQPWLGSIREAIHGMYQGSEFDASLFPNTGLRSNFTTYVLTYYDQRAAGALNKVWGASAMEPQVTTANTQIPEGGVIVKAAFVDVTGEQWDAMKGAAQWPLYVPINGGTSSPKVTTASFMQFDIIVKDSKSSPKTGWVFSTLVYDANAPGEGWDKMVPLGAMWGNDPQADSSKSPPPPLTENWINPKAPLYSTETLGWGGRLSGPNDGATNDIMVNGVAMMNAADSSCMSCHSPAEWKMKSFLLPSFPNQAPPPPFKTCGTDGAYICSPAPGSSDWMRWFQNRPGTQPMDDGTVATDYDMVFAFKALPAWAKAVGQPVPEMLRPRHGAVEQRLNYNGVPTKGSANGAKVGKKVPKAKAPFTNDH